MIEFSMYKQAGYKDQLFIAIFVKCILFKKKGTKFSKKRLHLRFLIEDNAGNNEELMYQNVPWRNLTRIIQQC